MAGGPPLGLPYDPYTLEKLAAMLDHLAELQANQPLVWQLWERERLHGWARWVRGLIAASDRTLEAFVEHAHTHEPPWLALALDTSDALVVPEPPSLDPESALRTAPDAAWRAAWRAGWAAGWVAGRGVGRSERPATWWRRRREDKDTHR